LKDLSILFLGTPEFAATSLIKLVEEGFNIVGVVTAPDKPSGRGLKMHASPVKEVALLHGLPVFQPVSLRDPVFLSEIAALSPTLGIVIAFRMLPRALWSIPPLGTFNLHASLLPQYRGAAPVNRAVMNGERMTGLTTFLLDDQIDTGKILLSHEVPIGEEETAGELHDRMMVIGADLVVRTIRALAGGTVNPVNQSILETGTEGLKTAPKIFREDCRIQWDSDINVILNHIRGLSPYPGAFTTLTFRDGTSKTFKIFRAIAEHAEHNLEPGSVRSDGRTFLKIAARNGYIQPVEIQLEGRKMMNIVEFLKGAGLNFS